MKSPLVKSLLLLFVATGCSFLCAGQTTRPDKKSKDAREEGLVKIGSGSSKIDVKGKKKADVDIDQDLDIDLEDRIAAEVGGESRILKVTGSTEGIYFCRSAQFPGKPQSSFFY